MDLLFFANTRHLKHADEKLVSLGLGRAHHRVLYFVKRKPDLPVTDLLSILDVTKQSLGRVSKDLQLRGMLEMRTGDRDRRQRLMRLMRLTPAGIDLEASIFGDMHANVARTYAASGGDAVAGFWTVLQHLIGDEGRQQFAKVQRLGASTNSR